MNDKQIYMAYVLTDNSEFGQQLLRYAFEYPIVEYWGEPEEQAKLKAYFKENHYSHDEPLIIEEAQILDFMPYAAPKPNATLSNLEGRDGDSK